MVQYAKSIQADIALATDPDCDRMGCSCPISLQPDSPWATINGNQLGVLLTDYVISKRKQAGDLPKDAYVIKTLVTTELTRSVAESQGVRCEGNIHVGFKWIAGLIDACGPEGFVFGTEESHGYLIGTYARDKDGAVACLLMAQLAADLKAAGKTLHERLDELMLEHGVYLEDLINVQMEGSQGMANMKRLMDGLRTDPPKSIGGLEVLAVRDYGSLVRRTGQSHTETMQAPKSNMLMLELASRDGGPSRNAIAVRPSGTEPKIKFYLFGHEELAEPTRGSLQEAKHMVMDRLAAMKKDLAGPVLDRPSA
jgi:phosphoglucomutase/phosphomannomutase